MNQAALEVDYQAHLKLCLRFDSWLLKTACRLVTGGTPTYTGEEHPSAICEALYEAALSCAGGSLPVVDTQVPFEELRVVPSAFVHWAMQLGVPLDPAFRKSWGVSDKPGLWDTVEELNEFKKLFKDATGHQLPQNIAAKLRDFDVRRKSKLRCRALAAYFWSKEPSLTKAEIARKSDLRVIGCEGERFNERQVGEWIADLNPSPAPGRPKMNRE